MKKIKISSKVKDFEVQTVDDFKFVDELSKIENSVVIVGEKVFELYKNKIFKKFSKDKLIILPLEEKNKTLDTVVGIYAKLLEKTAKKNLTLITFGGGVNQDVVGFVASTLYRGVGWIHVPTTLLSMADSSVGLKTSLNLNKYKNVIGTFYPPEKVIINSDFLNTLPKLNYFSGLGEIIKLYLTRKEALKKLNDTITQINSFKKSKDRKFIDKVILKSLQIKLDYMKGDEFDRGRRNLLNYGHELGHALEPASSYSIPHGIAVLIGIMFANIVSYKRKMLDKKTMEEINQKLILPNIPFDVIKLKKSYFQKEIILKNMRKDKKVIDEGLVLVLPQKDLSLIKVNNLTIDEYYKSLIDLIKLLPQIK